MRIFYVTAGQHIGGGQLVNLEHVRALRALGYDANLAVLKGDTSGFAPVFPPGPEVPWVLGLPELTPEDVVVVGEMFGFGASALGGTPARKVIHNQGPYYTFSAFSDLQSCRAWGAEAMICASGIAAEMVRRMGWTAPLPVVRPFIDPVFRRDPAVSRAVKVAYLGRKRLAESRLIRGILRSQRPDLNSIPWVQLTNRSRAEVAVAFQHCEVFLALGEREGLGLPPLEAMACGALVVGFHAGGGREYATPENGDWFDDDQHFEIAETLAERLDALRAGEPFTNRRDAGYRTAGGFNRAAFEAQLAAAWAQILGPPPAA